MSGYDPQRSQINSMKIDEFLSLPLSPNLIDVPGVSSFSAQVLKNNGIYSSYALIGKFLSFKDDENSKKSIIRNCNEFFYFLSDIGTSPGYRSSIVQAIALKANQMIPGIYDETVFS
jgi:hypothetical protein